jgi:hypothetical protein
VAEDGGRDLTVLSERSFVHEGATWRVREVRDPRGIRSLVFEHGNSTRKVRGVPSEWKSLDEDALVRLSWRR